MATFAKTTFSHASYAAFRPSYPPALYNTILSYHRGPKTVLVDLGTGHGIVTRTLAPDFTRVIGTDPSAGMIAQARLSTPSSQYPHVEYHSASAESLPLLKDGSVDIVVAAQAAHWFDYKKVWPEMRRVLRKHGTIAFWGYKDHVFVDYPKATAVLHEYAYGLDKEKLGSYWSQPGRSIVEDKLRPVVPPEEWFEDVRRIEYEPQTEGKGSGEGTMFVSKRMTVGQNKDYVRTWSSFHGWQETHLGVKKRAEGGKGDVVDQMFEKMASLERDFEDENKEVEVEWGSGLVLARLK